MNDGHEGHRWTNGRAFLLQADRAVQRDKPENYLELHDGRDGEPLATAWPSRKIGQGQVHSLDPDKLVISRGRCADLQTALMGADIKRRRPSSRMRRPNCHRAIIARTRPACIVGTGNDTSDCDGHRGDSLLAPKGAGQHYEGRVNTFRARTMKKKASAHAGG